MDRATLHRLQALRSYPSVSVLLNTAPAERLTPDDADRLRLLLGQVERRLIDDVGPDTTVRILRALASLELAAAMQPTGLALALFASDELAIHSTLAVPVRERVVIDETFATRDAMAHVHRAVRFVVVAVSERTARAFEGDRARLIERSGHGLPLERVADESDEGWMRRVARAVNESIAGDALPVLLAGVERATNEARKRLDAAPIGNVAGAWEKLPWSDLHRRSLPVLDAWLTQREHSAMLRLDEARSARRFAAGIHELWELANAGRVAMLVAERGFEFPARVDGMSLREAPDDVEAPDVVDDVVDELIEVVVTKGGNVILVPDGNLHSEGRVAAELRF